MSDKPISQLRAEADEEQFVRELVSKHGGGFHGPRVEHLSMEEQAFYRMMREFRERCKDRYQAMLRFYDSNPNAYPTTTRAPANPVPAPADIGGQKEGGA